MGGPIVPEAACAAPAPIEPKRSRTRARAEVEPERKRPGRTFFMVSSRCLEGLERTPAARGFKRLLRDDHHRLRNTPTGHLELRVINSRRLPSERDAVLSRVQGAVEQRGADPAGHVEQTQADVRPGPAARAGNREDEGAP